MAYLPLTSMATVSDGGRVQENISSAVRRITSKDVSDGELIEDVSLLGGVALGGPELLLHLNDNVTEAMGNHTFTASNLDAYVDSDAGGDGTGDSGFGKAASFSPDAGGAGVHSYIGGPDIGIGTGDMTVEWWSYFDTTPNGTRRHTPFSFLISGTSSYLYLTYFNGNDFYISDYVNSAYFSSSSYQTRGGGASKYSHWVVTRKAQGDGTSTFEVFHQGAKLSLASGSDNWATNNITSLDIGRLTPLSDASYNWGHEGKIDEFVVYDSVISTYDGETSYTVPTEPYSPGSSSAGRVRQVRHHLGRKAKGAMVVKKSGPSDVRVLSSVNSFEVPVSSTADVDVSLWVF